MTKISSLAVSLISIGLITIGSINKEEYTGVDQNFIGYFFLIISVLIYSFFTTIFKYFSSTIPPENLNYSILSMNNHLNNNNNNNNDEDNLLDEELFIIDNDNDDDRVLHFNGFPVDNNNNLINLNINFKINNENKLNNNENININNDNLNKDLNINLENNLTNNIDNNLNNNINNNINNSLNNYLKINQENNLFEETNYEEKSEEEIKNKERKEAEKDEKKRYSSSLLATGLIGLFGVLFMWPGIILLDILNIEEFEIPTWTIIGYLFLAQCLAALQNVAFLIGIHFTSPLFMSVGILLTIPTSILFDWLLHDYILPAVSLCGVFLLCFSFLLFYFSDYFISHYDRFLVRFKNHFLFVVLFSAYTKHHLRKLFFCF